MDYDFTVHFTDGARVEGAGSDDEGLTTIANLVAARRDGYDAASIGVQGGHRRTVGDVASVELSVRF